MLPLIIDRLFDRRLNRRQDRLLDRRLDRRLSRRLERRLRRRQDRRLNLFGSALMAERGYLAVGPLRPRRRRTRSLELRWQLLQL